MKTFIVSINILLFSLNKSNNSNILICECFHKIEGFFSLFLTTDAQCSMHDAQCYVHNTIESIYNWKNILKQLNSAARTATGLKHTQNTVRKISK